MRPSRRASAASSLSSLSESVSTRPPATARYSDGRSSSSPARMISPVVSAFRVDCIARKAGQRAAGFGYRSVNALFPSCERPRGRPVRALASGWMRRRPDPVLLELFEQAGRNVQRTTLMLRDMLAEFPDRAGLARDIYACEQEGDRIAHDILHRLAQRGAR